MILSLGIILLLGITGGILVDKIKIPRLVYYLLLGILLGPSLLNIIDNGLLEISPYLRQIALIIILTRSGLSLKLKNLKEIGRPAILMCFIPACFEIVGVLILGPLFLDLSILESLLLGSVLAAVSPAVIVPRMIKFKNEGYGNNHHVPELIMAGASCDDIFVIILFYTFKELLVNSSSSYISFLKLPISLILGVAIGILLGLLISFIFSKIKLNNAFKVVIILSLSLLLVGSENINHSIVNFSSLLAIITMGITILAKNDKEAKEIENSYNQLWVIFEILLFVLIGAQTNIEYAFSTNGLYILLTLILALLFRVIGVIICLLFTKFTFKEKLFIVISYLPKATVQASIGAIALQEGLDCGVLVLTAAVVSILFTAPLGALAIDLSYKKLLNKEDDNIISS